MRNLANKRWFDDWNLTMAQSADRIAPEAYIEVDLPHGKSLQQTRVYGSPEEIKLLANLLDALLCELTGTKSTKKIEADNGLRPRPSA